MDESSHGTIPFREVGRRVRVGRLTVVLSVDVGEVLIRVETRPGPGISRR